MINVKKISVLVFVASAVCGSPVVAMDDVELMEAERAAKISRLKKEAAENDLAVLRAEAESKRIATLGVTSEPKPTGLYRSVNKPRPADESDKGAVLAHNVEVETARGIASFANALQGKGWRWK